MIAVQNFITQQNPYPFLYFGEGCSYFEKSFECCIWFEKQLSEQDRKIIIQNIPFPQEIFRICVSGDSVFFFYGNEHCEYIIKEKFNPDFKKLLLLDKEGKSSVNIWKDESNFMPSPEEWVQFDHCITQWLIELHKKFPIAFVFKPAKFFKKATKNKYGYYGSWHEWSIDHLSEVILPHIQSFYEQPHQDQKLNERMSWLTTKILEESLKKLKGKSKKILSKKHKFFRFAELLCEHDGVYTLTAYDGNEEIIFRNGRLLEELVKDFASDEQRYIIAHLSPYTQLVLFSTAEFYPYVLLFEKPLDYLRSLLEKIDPVKKNIFSTLICRTMTLIRLYWQDIEPQKENKEILLELADFVVNLSSFEITNYIKAEFIFLKYGHWEKVLKLYTNNDYLLQFSNPAEHLLEIIVKIPAAKSSFINTYLRQIIENISECKEDPKKFGFPHDYSELARKISSFLT